MEIGMNFNCCLRSEPKIAAFVYISVKYANDYMVFNRFETFFEIGLLDESIGTSRWTADQVYVNGIYVHGI